MGKLVMLLLFLGLRLEAIESQGFKCPPISRYNDSMEMADVCVCNDKHRKIMCRIKIFNLESFGLLPDYTDFIRRSLTYDRMHLNLFQLCFNINYDVKQSLPLLLIKAELLSELRFDQIIISYCDHKHTNPIKLMIEPNFLEMQTETLHRLEIEIPAGVDDNGRQVLLDLAQAISSNKRLEYMVIWMDAKLNMYVPDFLFGKQSSFSYEVPLAEILMTNHHHLTESDDVGGDDQISASIGSFAFLHLKRLKLVTLHACVLHKVAAFAFASLYPMSPQLTVNFTDCNLLNTVFDPKAFLGFNRTGTIYFGHSTTSLVNQAKLFIPPKETFSEFLLEHAENKLQFNYKVACNKKEVYDKVQWMLNSSNRLSTKQIELFCHTGKSIFKYFKV